MRRLMPSGGQGYLSVQCRIATCSFPALAADLQGLLHLAQGGRARGEQHGLAHAGGAVDEPMAGQVGGGDLEGGHVQRGQEVHRLVVEGRGECGQPDVLGVAEQGLEVAVGQLVELVERIPLRAVRIRGLDPVARGHAGGDLARGVALELDGVGPRRPRRLHELVAELHVAVVVDARLRDHVAGRHPSDRAAVDEEGDFIGRCRRRGRPSAGWPPCGAGGR